jgi:hypothetical protein
MAGVSVSIHGGLTDTMYAGLQRPLRAFIEETAGVTDNNSFVKKMFNVTDASRQSALAFGGRTALGLFKPRGEKEPHAVEDFQDVPEKILVYRNWGMKVEITGDMMDFREYEIKPAITQIPASFYKSREDFATRFYGAASRGATSFKIDKFEFDTTTADGHPLFDTTHPSAVTPSRKQSNAFSNPLTADNLGLAQTAMQKFEGHTKNRLGISPDTIIIPNDSDMKKTLWAIVGSEKDPESAGSNAWNYQFATWNVYVIPDLDKYVLPGSKPWILMDSAYLKAANAAVWNDWKGLSVRSVHDPETDVNTWYADTRYNAVFINWQYACCGGIAGGTTLT